ncbi:MAG TPA: hypothetical protein VIO11_07185, partial [Candidatus Methanoperedens sp.]
MKNTRILLNAVVLFAVMNSVASASVPVITDLGVTPSSHINQNHTTTMTVNVIDNDLEFVGFAVIDVNNLIRPDRTIIYRYTNRTGVSGKYTSTSWYAKKWEVRNQEGLATYITADFVDDPLHPLTRNNIKSNASFKKNDTTDSIYVFMWFSKLDGSLSRITNTGWGPDPVIESGKSSFKIIKTIFGDNIDKPPVDDISVKVYTLYNIGDSRNPRLFSSQVPEGYYKVGAPAKDVAGNMKSLSTDIDTIPIMEGDVNLNK